MKRCSRCKQEKPLGDFYKKSAGPDGHSCYCKQCNKERAKEWKRTPKGKLSQRLSWQRRDKKRFKQIQIKSRYGLSEEQQKTLMQKESCELCGRAFSGREPCIDHDHANGMIRGLLCMRCNTMLGYAKDDPGVLRKAADYLESHSVSLRTAQSCRPRSAGPSRKRRAKLPVGQEPNTTQVANG